MRGGYLMELDELKTALEEMGVDLSDMDDILSVAGCSSCCAEKNGG